ncbi:MAG: replicative DNA helicase [Rhodobacteraceae bacterium]|nr:replicative DNA helicase [Paracoccaceae bacterium]
MDNVSPIRKLDLPDGASQPSGSEDGQICSIEAEQALLGAILTNNNVFAPVSEVISTEHFHEPVHRELYSLIAGKISNHSIADPVTLNNAVENIPGLAALGGVEYLVRLASAAVSVHASKDYAREIYDLARRRELTALGMELVDRARRIDPGLSVTDIIHNAETDLYKLCETGQRGIGFQSFLKSINEAISIAKTAASRRSGLAGMPTGLIDLDYRLGGLHPSDLVIVAGRPSMGKTALATNIAFNVARNFNKRGISDDANSAEGGNVGFFSLEMSSAQLAARILSESSRITTSQLRRSQLNAADFKRYAQAAAELQSVPLYIDDTPALTISQIATRARRLKAQHDLHLLVVDYLQLVRATTEKDNRVNEVSEVSRGLKAIAKDLDIPVIAVSQLSRSVENRDDKRPQLSDLRESGSIEQDADVVMFVYREAYYLERKKPDETDSKELQKWTEKMDAVGRTAEIIISKQRHGPIGTVELMFDGKYTLFSNKAQHGYSDPGSEAFR